MTEMEGNAVVDVRFTGPAGARSVRRATRRRGARAGRLSARFPLLLALALLVGALGLFPAEPAQAQSSDTTLSGLTVEVSTDGTNFSTVGIHPEFSSGQLAYDTVVSTSHTHARVIPTANHAATTLKVGKNGTTLTALASGSASAAVALANGANSIRIQVTAEDGDTESYYVNVTRGGRVVAAPPRYVKATAGAAKLTLTWTAPAYWGSFPAGGYEVDWYAGSSPPADDTDWNRATRTVSPLAATATSYEFTGTYGSHTVANGTTYQLRIRAFGTNPGDSGDTLPSDWVVVAGTPPGTSSQSSDARLSGLTASTGTSAGGTFTALTLTPSTFSAATTAYAATVPNATTHLKLTPTVNESNATVKVGRQGTTLASVSSGSASGAIALAVGANPITVRVTAQDSTTTRDYTVAATRRAARSTPSTATGVTLSASDDTPTEGNSVTLTATLDNAAPAGGVTLTLKVLAEVSRTIYTTATETADYRLSSNTISIGQGGTTGTATLFTVNDSTVEDTSYSVAGETVVLSAGSTTPALGSKPLVIAIVDNDGPFAGRRPGQPSLAAVASGTNAPTATTLTFNVGCVSGGGSLVTDYVLWAENVDDPSDYRDQVFPAPDPALAATCNSIARTMTGLPGRAGATTWRVRAYARNIAGFRSPWSRSVELATTGTGMQVVGGGAEDTTPREPPDIVTTLTVAREGQNDNARFLVKLSRAAANAVSVDYASADGTGAWKGIGPATAGADYTAVSGRLSFAPGQTRKFVAVPLLDDAVDEGTEHFLLRFSNPKGAWLRDKHREAVGLIVNDDPLQTMWLSRFGRTVGSQVTDAVSERLADGLAPGARATLGGQSLDLSRADDGKALAETMTGLARAFGAPDAPAANDGPFARHRPGDAWNDPARTTTARSMTGRELLLGSSFHLATEGEGSGPGLAAWGRLAHSSFDGGEGSDSRRTRVDGEVVTGTLGADAEWRRVLAGVAFSVSDGRGGFDRPGVDRGSVESTLATVTPYARFRITERVSAWGLAGWGAGDMTIVQDARAAMETRAARPRTVTRTDIAMRMAAVGARGALLTQDDADGMDLALKADAFLVRVDSEKAANSAQTGADASRVRLVLEGGRRFDLGGGAALRPSMELGVRHDGGDAETGAGVEIGGGVAWVDAASGLSIEAKARVLAAHADSDYREWGANATVRLDPGGRGRGLSLSLSPALGTTSGAADRLWSARDARGFAPGSGFDAARGLQTEAGYGVALFGGRFTGTPNAGFGMSDGGAREYRIGWRLAPAAPDGPRFEVDLDATRREPAGRDGAGHGAMLRGAVKW